MLQPVSDRMMDLADIRPGQQVLDVATGIGEPAVTAALSVGPAGRVIATDIAPQMLDIGQKRVTELTLDNIDFREMDAEVLELPESNFDAILCRFLCPFWEEWSLFLLIDSDDSMVIVEYHLTN
jgi:ubiquinone/menaquinone biosynthesis C-methylase UbiE